MIGKLTMRPEVQQNKSFILKNYILFVTYKPKNGMLLQQPILPHCGPVDKTGGHLNQCQIVRGESK